MRLEEKMAAGALPRTGPFIDSSACVVSGLVHCFGRLDFVTDNTGALEGLLVGPSGCVIPIGNVLVCMAVVPGEGSDGYPDEVLSDGCGTLGSFDSDGYPSEVLSDGCSSFGSDFDAFPDVVEVFTASSLPNRRATGEGGVGARDGVGCSNTLVPNWLTEVLDSLRTPVTPGENVETQAAELDAVRQQVLETAETVVAMTRQVQATVNEFNSTRGLPADGCRTQVCQRGRQVAVADDPQI